MPVETNRKRSVRRIYAPGTKKDDKDKTYIPLKITDEITFMDEKPPHQEWVLSFKNDPSSTRSVTTAHVGKDSGGKDLPKAQQLQVERIETIETAEDRGIHQEAIWSFLGNKSNPPVHLETYNKKIYLSDEKGNITDKDTWIEVQRIKAISFEDEKDNPADQEYIWTLKHSDEEDSSDDYTDIKDAVTKWDFTDINPPYRIDPFQTITDCSFGKSVLVLYGANKIAYFNVADIANPTASNIKKKTLQSSWDKGDRHESKYGTQLKFSDTVHIAATTIRFNTDGTVALLDYPNVTYSNLKNSLLVSASNPGSPPNLGDGSILFNGDATGFYDGQGSRFSINKKGEIKFVSANSNFTGSPDVMAVDGKGGYYGSIFANGSTVFVLNQYKGSQWVTNQQMAIWQSVTSSRYRTVWGFSTGPSDSDITTDYWYGDTSHGAPYSISHNNSLSSMVMVHSNDGKKDIIKLQPVTVNYGMSDAMSDSWNGSQSEYLNYAGIGGSGNLTISGGIRNQSWSGYNRVTCCQTYHLGNTYDKMFLRYTLLLGDGTATIQTPYGVDQIATLYDIHPWLFVANGKHYIHGCDIYDVQSLNPKQYTRFWLNGKPYGDKLSAAIGCAPEDIKLILLDVKTSDIKKLK